MHNITIKKIFWLYWFFIFFLFLAWDFSSCNEQGLLFVAACRASHCRGFCSMGSRLVGFSSCNTQALDHRLLSYVAWAYLLHSMRNLPRQGTEPVSPVLAGRFLSTEPPGKSQYDSVLEAPFR